MAVENITISAEPRTSGKHFSRGYRQEQKIPAVIYGPNVKNLQVNLGEIELTKYNKIKFENAIFVLKSDDKALNGLKVLKKEVAIHPVTRRPIHVDLYALDMTKAIRVDVEIRFEGKSVGIKEGGILNIVRRDVTVEVLPSAIPEYIAIDITNLGLGDSFHASDLTIPDGLKLLTLPTGTICTIVTVEEEKVAVVEVAAAAPGAAPAAGAPAAPGAAPAAGAAAAAPAAKK